MIQIKVNENINGRNVDVKLLSTEYKGYFVSEYSDIYSNNRGNFKKREKGKYNGVTLKVNRENVHVRSDKLCLKHFKPLEKEKKYIMYIDKNSKNSHYTNMEWTNVKQDYRSTSDKIMKTEEIVYINSEEILKEVEVRQFGYSGYYISEYGNPYYLVNKKLKSLKIQERKTGFHIINFTLNKERISIEVNVATAKAFIPIEKELPFVLFKDKNRLNTHYSNLYWSMFCEEPDPDFHALPGFEKYKFNKVGVCKSYQGKYPKIIRPGRDDNGYYFYYVINDKGKPKIMRRNRIIATIFIPNPDNKPQVDHLNRKRHDDRVENLSWATSSENNKNRDLKAIAEKLYKSVGKFDMEGNLIEEYKNSFEAAADIETENFLSVPGSIRSCAVRNKGIYDFGKCSTMYGYIWQYMYDEYKYNLLPGEILIPIKNDYIESSYFITNYLNIINKHGYKKHLHILGGYPTCPMSINGKYKMMRMHRIVGLFFVEGRTKERDIINHKDENRLNYHPSNLEWCTSSENNLHSIHKKNKIIDQYDVRTGEFIKRFKSAKEAAKTIPNSLHGTIRDAANKVKNAYGYIWKYGDSIILIPDDVKDKIKTIRKPVDQFTLEGKFVKRYESISSAREETGVGNISFCCFNIKSVGGGYLWREADISKIPSDIDPNEKDEGQYPKKPVIKKTRGGVFLERYENIFIAAKENKITAKRINEGCTGKYQSVANHRWEYG